MNPKSLPSASELLNTRELAPPSLPCSNKIVPEFALAGVPIDSVMCKGASGVGSPIPSSPVDSRVTLFVPENVKSKPPSSSVLLAVRVPSELYIVVSIKPSSVRQFQSIPLYICKQESVIL